jgi:hypothetical protein
MGVLHQKCVGRVGVVKGGFFFFQKKIFCFKISKKIFFAKNMSFYLAHHTHFHFLLILHQILKKLYRKYRNL